MTVRLREALHPVAVDRCHETKPCGTVRGHRSGVVLHETSSHLDQDAALREEPGLVSPWITSRDVKTPPEVFLG